MQAGEVLDIQAELITRCQQEGFRTILSGFAMASSGSYSQKELQEVEKNVRNKRAAIEAYGPMVNVLSNHVKISEAYRVTADMGEVLKVAAAQLDGLDRFDHKLAPTPAGFVSFDVPLPVTDIRGKTMLIHYMTWGPARGAKVSGTLVWMFNDGYRKPDEVWEYFEATTLEEKGEEGWEKVREIQGRWGAIGCSMMVDGARMGATMWEPSGQQKADVEEEGFEAHAGTNTMRYLHALWLLLNQTITVTESEEIPRHFKRRALRHNLKPHVTVIKLRRKEHHGGDGESGIEYHVQWLVRGHWRNQVCGAEYPGAFEIKPGQWRSRIWVSGYVKGNPDAPFKMTEKLYSLDR